jgi:hypothetical protein
LLVVTGITTRILSFGFFSSSHTGNVESHLDKLVSTSGSFGTLGPGTAKLGIRTRLRESHLYCDFISTSKVGIADF